MGLGQDSVSYSIISISVSLDDVIDVVKWRRAAAITL